MTIDHIANGFIKSELNPNRYPTGYANPDPMEAHGMITSLIPIGARVLDVGCGAGALSKFIQLIRNAEVIGVEPEPHRAEMARKQGLQVVENIFTYDAVTGLGNFDVVVFADVIEHLIDPHSSLLTAKSIIKHNGSIVISVPNVAHWTVRANLLRGKFEYQPTGIMDATHVRWFTKNTLINLVESVGLKVTSIGVTAGKWMPDYCYSKPWKWMSTKARNRIVNNLSKKWPELFGCQHIISVSKN